MNRNVNMLAKFVLVLTAALGSAAHAQDPKSTFTVVRSDQWGAQNFNPFTPGSQHLLPTNSAIYETLFFVNSINGKVTPVLGTKYAWSSDNKTLTVTTRPGVKWSDGQAFDASDVAFTFNYLKKYPVLDLTGIWKNGLDSVKAPNATTVVFSFSKPNTPTFPFIANTPIVPEHLWASQTDPATFTNAKPVGTGPFVFDSYSQQALRVLKNPNYWLAGRPYVDAVVWLSTNSNDAALFKLIKGDADYGYVGISDPIAYTKQNKNTAYWWPTNNSNFLTSTPPRPPSTTWPSGGPSPERSTPRKWPSKPTRAQSPLPNPAPLFRRSRPSGCPAPPRAWKSSSTRRPPTRPSRRRAKEERPGCTPRQGRQGAAQLPHSGGRGLDRLHHHGAGHR